MFTRRTEIFTRPRWVRALDLLRRYLDPGNADVGLIYLPLTFSYYKAYIFPRLCRQIHVKAPQLQLSLKLGFAGAHSAEEFWEHVKMIENVPLAKPVLLCHLSPKLLETLLLQEIYLPDCGLVYRPVRRNLGGRHRDER